MKGVSFQNGIEFRVSIEGESWSQGDTISGKLEAISRNANSPPPVLKIFLAEGTERRIKAKTPGAFEIQNQIASSNSPLEWSFPLPIQSRVSDKSGSLYIVYGNGEALENLGQLRLNIVPHLHLRDLIEVMGTHFRFVNKGISAGNKGWVDIKFDPPQAKEWAALEQLVLQLRLEEKTLEARFAFQRKEVDAMKAGLQTKLVTREIEKSWDLSRMIHDFNGRLNKEATTDTIENVLTEYRGAGWMPG